MTWNLQVDLLFRCECQHDKGDVTVKVISFVVDDVKQHPVCRKQKARMPSGIAMSPCGEEYEFGH